MAKQYKTWELIKAWQEGETGEFTCGQTTVILVDGRIEFKGSGSAYYISAHDKTFLWTKVQEPVDFMTAINSGKRIKIFGSKSDFAFSNQWLKNIGYYENYVELINGKWELEELED